MVRATKALQANHPTVVFVDDFGWDSFDQVAAGLRRRGIRTVRAGRPRASGTRSKIALRRVADRLFYNETITLGDAIGRDRLLGLLASQAVADVITNEPTLKNLGSDSDLVRQIAARSLSAIGTPLGVLIDKYEVNRRLPRHGVQAPRQARAQNFSVSEAVGLLGLPLVVKDAVGAGGAEVRIAPLEAEVASAIVELGGDPSALFFQEYVDGELALYAAVIGPDGPMIEKGFSVRRTQYDEGPSAIVRLIDDPDLLVAGRRTAAMMGCRGFLECCFIRAGDGRLLHIDSNCRVWGHVCAPLPVGVDFTASYAALVTGSPSPAAPMPQSPDVDLPVFPFCLADAAARGSVRELGKCIKTAVAPYARALGSRYLVYLVMQASMAFASRWETFRRSAAGAMRNAQPTTPGNASAAAATMRPSRASAMAAARSGWRNRSSSR